MALQIELRGTGGACGQLHSPGARPPADLGEQEGGGLQQGSGAVPCRGEPGRFLGDATRRLMQRDPTDEP